MLRRTSGRYSRKHANKPKPRPETEKSSATPTTPTLRCVGGANQRTDANAAIAPTSVLDTGASKLFVRCARSRRISRFTVHNEYPIVSASLLGRAKSLLMVRKSPEIRVRRRVLWSYTKHLRSRRPAFSDRQSPPDGFAEEIPVPVRIVLAQLLYQTFVNLASVHKEF